MLRKSYTQIGIMRRSWTLAFQHPLAHIACHLFRGSLNITYWLHLFRCQRVLKIIEAGENIWHITVSSNQSSSS